MYYFQRLTENVVIGPLLVIPNVKLIKSYCRQDRKMSYTAYTFQFHKDDATVLFNGRIVVDLHKVPNNAKAKVHSAFQFQSPCVETNFTIDDSKVPFHVDFVSFTPKALIKAIIENHLEVEGMIVHEDIQDAYDYISHIENLTLQNIRNKPI